MIYLDYPDEQIIQGSVVWKNNGKPVPGANVTIWEGRSFITLLPIAYPAAAQTVTNERGMFSVTVKTKWPTNLTANVLCGFGKVTVAEKDIQQIIIEIESKSSEDCASNPSIYKDRAIKRPPGQ